MAKTSKKELNFPKLFGTDGIRGKFGEYPLTDKIIMDLGCSVACLTRRKKRAEGKVVIGKDTRSSGARIEQILTEALTSYGIDVLTAGTITTPGLSFSVKHLKADMGIMISASHNKASDNGLKIFKANAHKLTPREETIIERIAYSSPRPGKAEKTGRIINAANVKEVYMRFLISTVKGLSLSGMRIALDCACGAASFFARELFESLGAEVESIHDSPTGDNINEGGATQPSILCEFVKKTGSSLGIALDGDGDRGILIDENGTILDGDFILAIAANHMLNKNELKKNTLVTTVMSNYGLKESIERNNGRLILTSVGDKHVIETLSRQKLHLGGEQSGHIIFYRHMPTPDGLLTALQLLKIMKESQETLGKLSKCMSKWPQILLNVRVKEKTPFDKIPELDEMRMCFDSRLKDKGRILLRYSGTEPLARVMVEGKDKEEIETIARSLAEHIKDKIGT